MVRHVAVFTWKPGIGSAEIAVLERALGSLPSRVPEIRSYQFGVDAGLGDDNADFAVVADFDDAAAYDRYARHPAHQDVITNVLRPMLGERTALQFVIDG